MNLGPASEQLWSDLKFRSEENIPSTTSISSSLISNTTGGSDTSRISVQDTYNDSSCLIKEPPDLSSEQLSLVKYSWDLVSVDTSNICINFFHQLQRQFTPKIKKRLLKNKNVHSSTPSLYRGNKNSYSNHQILAQTRSCTSCQTRTHTSIPGQITQQALKLACCLDAVIGSLTRNSKIKKFRKTCRNVGRFRSSIQNFLVTRFLFDLILVVKPFFFNVLPVLHNFIFLALF